MKSASLTSNGIALIRKLVPTWEKLRQLTAADFLFCLFTGVLSQGALFGIIKPFGVAFYAAYPGSVFVRVLMLMAIIAGNLIGGDLLTALRHTVLLLLYEWLKLLLRKDRQDNDVVKIALLNGAAAAVMGLLVLLVDGMLMESIVITVMEVVLVSVVTALFSVTLLGREATFRDRYVGQKNMEYLGWLVMGGAFLLGVSGIRFSGVSLDRIMAGVGLLMLTSHFGPGFGACTGAIAGLSMAAAYPGSLASLIGIYAASGLAAGMFQKSKPASGIGFFIVQLLFILTVKDVHLSWIDPVISVALFWLLPGLKAGKLAGIRRFVSGESKEGPGLDKVRRILSKRLENMSTALCKLGHTVEKQIRSHSESGGETVGAVMEQLTQQVCSFCGKSSTCWETKLFFTYKSLNTLIDTLQNHAGSGHEAEQELNRFCVKSGPVIDALLRILEIKRVDRVWQRAVMEAQNAIPDQIFSVSEVLSKISGEILQDDEIFEDEEDRIMTRLLKRSFPVYETDVSRSSNGRFMVAIHMEDCTGCQKCPGEIADIVSEVLGVRLVAEEGTCMKGGKGNCTLSLKEKETMGIITGIARMKKDKAKVSGDAFTFMRTREGKYIAVISDGMGSGREASKLSESAIGLFEQLQDCGLSIRLALSLVNMMLQITNPEKYATMDISSIDLYTGETEFYKMGAMPSLVIRDRNIDFIQLNNLPAGLHRENPVSYEKRKLSDGEFIIMMSDGAYDRLSNGNEKTLFEKVIHLKKTLNPQELAEHLLKKACGNTEDISDDMTVLVAKLWRKAG